TPAPHALRAVVLAEAAEVAASAGRFEQALALLTRAAALGPDGAAQAEGRRAEILARWLAALDAQGDPAGVATVYAAYTSDVQESAAPADRATVAHALGRLGLHRAALRVLAARADGAREPAVAVTLAEETFASGDIASALLQPAPEPPVSVLLTAAAAAAAEGAWNTAAETYARALAAGATAPERMLAAAGLVRIAHARGEPARATAALAALGATDDDLARRVGRALEKSGTGPGS